jgi:hypothetical protein
MIREVPGIVRIGVGALNVVCKAALALRSFLLLVH